MRSNVDTKITMKVACAQTLLYSLEKPSRWGAKTYQTNKEIKKKVTYDSMHYLKSACSLGILNKIALL